MTLRSRFKQRKLNEEVKEEPGSSYIRYEIIDKKGKQFLVPVRYSIRTAGDKSNVKQELERQILNNDLDFEYKPNAEMEGMFTMDQSAQEIKKLLADKKEGT